MIDAKQIPDEVVVALRNFIHEHPYGYDYRNLAAAALAAWPNNIFDHQYRNGRDYNSLILPLQEPRT